MIPLASWFSTIIDDPTSSILVLYKHCSYHQQTGWYHRSIDDTTTRLVSYVHWWYHQQNGILQTLMIPPAGSYFTRIYDITSKMDLTSVDDTPTDWLIFHYHQRQHQHASFKLWTLTSLMIPIAVWYLTNINGTTRRLVSYKHWWYHQQVIGDDQNTASERIAFLMHELPVDGSERHFTDVSGWWHSTRSITSVHASKSSIRLYIGKL